MIRPARVGDGPVLQEIELDAGARFLEVGMPDIAEAPADTLDVLAEYAEGGRCWVAVDGAAGGGDVPVAYVLADVVDGNGHVEQLSVRRAWQGRGLGRALVEQVASWARGLGLGALTLTTFTDVPWNRPLYEHLGFVVMGEDEIGPELRAVVAHEVELGLDPALRCCMRRPLP